MNYKAALEFATMKHGEQQRIGGEKYIEHPKAVANLLKSKGFNTEIQIVGLFHDLLEDTNATEKDIIKLSNQRVVNIVKLITKEKGYIIDEYIKRIRGNNKALNVKIADRVHNLQCGIVADEKFRRKYIAETYDYYYSIINYSKFKEEFIEALKKLEVTIKNEFYCSRCKQWHSNEKMNDIKTRHGKSFCAKCHEEYDISWDEFEDWLKQD